MFQGCAYRRRTGACCCENPPIGCVRDMPAPAPFKISFPAGATSYRELREGRPGGAVAPHAQAAAYAPQPPWPPPPDPTPRAACKLPAELPVAGSKRMPALGWRCTAADAVAAAAAGVRLLHADGDAAAETALGASCAPSDALLCTCVAALPAAAVADAATAAAARLRRLNVLFLRWDDNGDAPGLEEAFTAARSHAATLSPPPLLGVQCSDASAAPRCIVRLLALDGARGALALLALPLHPASGKWQRALLGLCRRSGVRVVALTPCAASALAATPALAAAAATRTCAPEHAAADALLAWCIGREVAAMPAAADTTLSHAVALLSSGALDLAAAQRAAVDAAGDELATAA